jgi:hypothetical protein
MHKAVSLDARNGKVSDYGTIRHGQELDWRRTMLAQQER